MIEPFERPEPAVVRPVAVRPVVVSRREHRWRFEAVQDPQRPFVERIVAGAVRALLEVAVVHAERQALSVHVGNQVRNAGCLLFRGVGKVAPQPDRYGLHPSRTAVSTRPASCALTRPAIDTATSKVAVLHLPATLLRPCPPVEVNLVCTLSLLILAPPRAAGPRKAHRWDYIRPARLIDDARATTM